MWGVLLGFGGSSPFLGQICSPNPQQFEINNGFQNTTCFENAPGPLEMVGGGGVGVKK